ncbi:MAG: aldo/keto reductase [Candidatus Eiseniibacteriota bacterium]
MDLRFLGSTGVKVSSLCLGTMTFGTKWEHVATSDQKLVDSMVAMALDHGINFFDTANVYSAGESEEQLGRALKGRRREDFLIATKVRGRTGPGPNDVGLSRHHIRNELDASLKRLGVDYIDLYQVHGWDRATAVEETLDALDDAVREGKVRLIGASNHAGWQLMKALAASDRRGLARYVSLQALYNAIQRDLEYELVPLSLDQGLAILPWSPLAGGFLTGKYRRGQTRPEGARRTDREKAYLQFDEERGFDLIDALDVVAKNHGATVSQAALQWLLARPGVTSVIIGARTLAHLEDNLGAVTWKITPEEVATLDAISSMPRVYPYWMIDQFHQTR